MEQNDRARSDSIGSRSTSSVELPAELVDRVELRLDRSEFNTVEEYVTFALEEILVRVEDSTGSEPTDTVERGEIEDRLRSLGYLE